MKLAIGLFMMAQFALAQGQPTAKVINQTLPQALEFLWKGYPIKK
jgi:hypothetical protein